MSESAAYQNALGRLRGSAATLKEGSYAFDFCIVYHDSVLARFQPIFELNHLDGLTEDEFRSFLILNNNHHWSGLHRHGPKMCADMRKLRKALKNLLDESKPIEERMDKATGDVKGMGKAVATAILIVAYPEKYGVWNSTSENGLRNVGLWPEFEGGETIGEKYARVNEVLLTLAADIGIDLWALDTLWWDMDEEAGIILDGPGTVGGEEVRFGLERHLHDFLYDNWENTELGKEWEVYSEEGDDAGYEYPTGIGKIDILARHRSKPRWLVVELKRGQSSDATVGQVLRYIGWVKGKMASAGEEVRGLVIAHEADDKIKYALNAVDGVYLMLYEVEFKLVNPT
ncbi:MAG: endonuclease NucS [Candidatus Zixiibacteriota bacterium]|jgi:hypothetical protein